MKRNRIVKLISAFFITMLCSGLAGQNWQQRANYTIEINMNVEQHQFSGSQTITYFNNAPDTLQQVFFHLYFNAFQPQSMMDVRSRNLPDPDGRIKDRISKLEPDEVGYHNIAKLEQNGKELEFVVEQTVLQASLEQPLAPGDSAQFYLQYQSQVPVQIRRSGRNNAEGVDYTMTQWFPKIAAYDANGWHPNPYVAREFYGPFGKYEVRITLPAAYKVGGTGNLQNFDQYWQSQKLEDETLRYEYLPGAQKQRTWVFKASQVHTFAWAADPEFRHLGLNKKDLPQLHFYYLPQYDSTWSRLPRPTAMFFKELNTHFGRYPYSQFSVIQGGDGGMEYPMCTMLKGTGKLAGLVGVMAHESAHNWYYGVMATNEFQYPWMDEGFTSFAEDFGLNQMRKEPRKNPSRRSIRAAAYMSGLNPKFEPLSTPADYFDHNRTYGLSAYSRGQTFLAQLQYILGKDAFFKGMRRYWQQYQFKHPTPQQFITTMEQASNVQLDWYLNSWVYTNHSIDYAVDTLTPGTSKSHTRINLSNAGNHPMPVRLTVVLKNGEEHQYYIPLVSMFGHTSQENWHYQKPWPWTHPQYSLEVPFKRKKIELVVLDRFGFTADVNPRNNVYPPLEPEED